MNLNDQQKALAREHILRSPHLFSARHNRDVETLAAHATTELGLDAPLTSSDVLGIVHIDELGPGASARATEAAKAAAAQQEQAAGGAAT